MFRKGDIGKFFDKTASERWLLLQSLSWLVIVRLLMLVMPFRGAVRLFGLSVSNAPREEVPASEMAAKIGWAVQAAAARTPRLSTCLMQALAASIMLQHRRMPVNLVLGVAKDATPEGGYSAHAWSSSGGVVLTGGQELHGFTPVVVFREKSGS